MCSSDLDIKVIITDIDDNDFYVMYNTSVKDKTVVIPPPPRNKRWYRVSDTSAIFPNDFLSAGSEEILEPQNRYILCARSMVILLSK